MSAQELARLLAQVKILERDMLTKRGKENTNQPPKEPTFRYTTKSLMRMTKKKLKELCDEHELDMDTTKMLKKDIVAAIMEATTQKPKQSEQPPPVPQPKPVLMDLEKLDEMKKNVKKTELAKPETKKPETKKPKTKKPETKKPTVKKPTVKKVKVVKSNKKSK